MRAGLLQFSRAHLHQGTTPVNKRYVIGLTAANRTGLLAALGTALAELGGDIHETSQTVISRFCTIILAADFPEHRDPEVIVNHIQGVCRPFSPRVCLMDPVQEQMQTDSEPGVKQYLLTLTGRDTPGVIGQISARLARDGIDITSLYAVSEKPTSSFRMVLGLAIPPGIDPEHVQTELEQLGAPIGLAAMLNPCHAAEGASPALSAQPPVQPITP